MTWWMVSLLVTLAVGVGVPTRPGDGILGGATDTPPGGIGRAASPGAPGPGWMMRFRWCWTGLAGVGAAVFLGGAVGLVGGIVLAIVVWGAIGRAESPDLVRRRDEVRRDLPHLVTLFGAALRSGAAPSAALELVCVALPGPAAEQLAGVLSRLAVGMDPTEVWESLAQGGELAPLGRSMARAQRTGASVVETVERLAEELARSARSEVEERARAVGVKAALPLGLCLLPAFILLGIVPLAAGLLAGMGL